jgi:hypothetical protein
LTGTFGRTDEKRATLEERLIRPAGAEHDDPAAARPSRRVRRPAANGERPDAKRPVRRLLAILPATDYREVSG